MGRTAGPGDVRGLARPVEFLLGVAISRGYSRPARDFLLFVCCFGAARCMLIHSIHGESNNTSERRMPYRCLAYGERCWKKRNEAANLVSSGTFPKITESEKQKRKNRNGICCFLKPAFYFFAWSCHLCASFIADSHTKSAVLSARDNRCAGSSWNSDTRLTVVPLFSFLFRIK